MEGLEKKEKTAKKRYSPSVLILAVCLAVSLISLILYLLDFNFNDKVLFFILNVLRYSSFFLCIVSFYRLVLNIYRVFRKRSVNIFLQIFLNIILIIYSLFIFFLEAFISAIAGGNG
jgi:cation transport ATPase